MQMAGGHGCLARAFRFYGRKVAQFPPMFIITAILFVGTLCAGMRYVTIDTDPDLIWVPPGSTTALQKKFFDSAYDPFFRINQVIIALADDDSATAPAVAGEAATAGSSSSSVRALDRRSFRALQERLFPGQGREAWAPGSPRWEQRQQRADAGTTTCPAGAHAGAVRKLSDAPGPAPIGGSGYDQQAVGILTPEYFTAIMNLQTALVNTPDSAGTVLDDICYKPIVGAGCLIETPLDYLFSDAYIIANNISTADIQDAIDCRKLTIIADAHYDYTPCWSTIHTPLLQDVVLGGIDCLHAPVAGFTPSVCGGCGRYASAVMLTFLARASDDVADVAAQWEQEVFLPVAGSFTHPGLRVSYMAQRSVSDEIEVVDQQNQNVVLISYVIMFCYIALALGRFPHPVYTRATLGLQGIAIVGLSVVGGIGIVSWSGMHITMIVEEVVPFLILALGVDNMFILTQAFDRAKRARAAAADAALQLAGGSGGSGDDGFYSAPAGFKPGSPASYDAPKRDAVITPSEYNVGNGTGHDAPLSDAAIVECVGDALAEVGPTILAAAISEVMAFVMGATTDIPALSQFCAVAAVAVGIDYVLQMLWFVAAISLDARRQAAHRYDIFCCWRQSRTSLVEEGAHDEEAASDVSCSSRCWRQVHEGRYVRRACSSYFAPALFLWPVRVVVLALWGLFLGTSLYGATQLALGLEQQLPMPQGSYLLTYFDDQSKLGEAGPPLYIVLQNVNYTDPGTPDAVQTIVDSLSTVSDWIEPPVASWVPQFVYWQSDMSVWYVGNNSGPGGRTEDCPKPLDAATTPYASALAQFIYDIPIKSSCCRAADYCAAQFSSDVKFIWGLPKGNASAVGVLHGGADPAFAATGAVGALDDGGCDMSAGYLLHGDVEAAIKAAGSDTGISASTATLTPAALAALPHAFRARLARAHEARLGLASGSLDHDDARALIAAVAAHQGALAAAAPPAAYAARASAAGPCNADLSNCTLSLIPCHVLTSRLRTQLVPLRNQSDFIGAMQHVQAAVSNLQAALPVVDLSVYGLPPAGVDGAATAFPAGIPGTFIYNFSSDNEHTQWLPTAPGGSAFPYSLTFVYYEQYNYIRGVAASNVALAVGAVFLAAYVVTSLPVATLTAFVVASITLNIIGFVYITNPRSTSPFGDGPYGVDINAISVVNLVAAAGLAVEFCVHIASYFSHATGSRVERARKAVIEMGASVFTGITLTKFVGVTVLAFAPSQLFRLYYFRMYFAIILFGAFHGLFFVPVLLSLIGWSPEVTPTGEHGSGSGLVEQKQRLLAGQDDEAAAEEAVRRGKYTTAARGTGGATGKHGSVNL